MTDKGIYTVESTSGNSSLNDDSISGVKNGSKEGVITVSSSSFNENGLNTHDSDSSNSNNKNNKDNNDGNNEKNLFKRFANTFKPFKLTDEQREEIGILMREANISEKEAEAKVSIANSPLSKSLKPRHLQMIAIGGSIGTGLFIGSGAALEMGGPASILISFVIVGIILYCTIHSLGELSVTFPTAGSFAVYSSRFLDPAWGFAMGWNYAIQWLIVFPLELVAASMTLDFWDVSINRAVWITIFWVVIVAINLFGVKGYGEAEFLASIIKVVAVVGYIIFGVIIVCGGGPKHEFIGGKYWRNPGAIANGFKGVCSVLVVAAFSFAGTEIVGLAAAESSSPRKSLPRAVKQVFWRIIIFYIGSLTLIGLLVPSNDPSLPSSGASSTSASPFTISIKNAGVRALPSIMNAVIMIALLSVGNASIFGCSRSLLGLAQLGMAPKCFSYIDREGRPLIGVAFTLIFGLLGYVSASSAQETVFSWLLALSGLSSIFTWGSICACHLMFRAAWKKKGRTLDMLYFKAQTGIIGSIIGLVGNILILIAQFWIALAPIGEPFYNAERFFKAYLAAPIVIVSYIGYKLYYKSKFVTPSTADIDSGVRMADPEDFKRELQAEEYELKKRSIFVRIYYFWC